MSDSNQLYKADGGKIRAGLIFEGCPKSLMLAAAVLSYGAIKYEAHSWKRVEGSRYVDAKFRHLLDMMMKFEKTDQESGLIHDAHELVNTLFILEQKLDQLSEDEFKALLQFNQPPQEHKNVS